MSDQAADRPDVVPLRPEKPVLFISHRHDDSVIADVLRKFIESRTGGRVSVFQSSSATAEGPKQGRSLADELRRALWHASVVVLIYTTRDQDWSYCMWECGVAQLPEPSEAKTIVFQCADQFPMLFADQLRVGLHNEQDIEKFTNDLLTDPTYFPKLGKPATEFDPGTEPVKEAARELYLRLQEVLPAAEGAGDEWPPYPHLRIELTGEQIDRMRKGTGSAEERLAVARQVIVDEAAVIGGDSQAGRIFGVRGFPRNPSMPSMPLRELVSSWEAASPTPASRWLDALCSQMLASGLDQFPALRWELMRGADGMDGTWYGPVVGYVRKVPRRRCTEFDVYFCKFHLDQAGAPKIGVPETVAET